MCLIMCLMSVLAGLQDGGPFGRAQVSHIDGLLRTLKLERRQVKADGNCFMACVALGLLDPASPWPDSDALSEAGAALRAVAVEFLKDWLQRHPADAKIYEDDQICDGKYTEEERPQIWQDYAAEMLQPGKPAHDFFMSMATAAHNVHMVLVQNGDGDSIRLRHFPEPPEEQLRLLQLQECGAHVPTVITALYSWSPTVWHHEIAAPLGATHVRDALSLQLPDEFTLKHCYYQHQSDESRSAAVRRQEKEAEQVCTVRIRKGRNRFQRSIIHCNKCMVCDVCINWIHQDITGLHVRPAIPDCTTC